MKCPLKRRPSLTITQRYKYPATDLCPKESFNRTMLSERGSKKEGKEPSKRNRAPRSSQFCLQSALNFNASLTSSYCNLSFSVSQLSTGILIWCLLLMYRLCGRDHQPPGYQMFCIHLSKHHMPQSVMAKPCLHYDGSHRDLSFPSLIIRFFNLWASHNTGRVQLHVLLGWLIFWW